MLPPSASCVVLSLSRRLVCENDQCSCFCQPLRRLRRSIQTSGVVLICESARPHSAVVTQQLLEQFKLDGSVCSAYSPDLATSDFHLFPELKNLLGG
ncbi:hypothetical protein AVEN_264558-1 [Araneus ventricosus]|uniref:Tc1-like transposase DDE domain-containing protein n=1 Tax=Araneus ventricosus TaxID=182803 RepID=A0A4Y2LB41_ARAVE|nr:hypothetical protein AVEN_264558-1 [Araneus ventricosus]